MRIHQLTPAREAESVEDHFSIIHWEGEVLTIINIGIINAGIKIIFRSVPVF